MRVGRGRDYKGGVFAGKLALTQALAIKLGAEGIAAFLTGYGEVLLAYGATQAAAGFYSRVVNTAMWGTVQEQIASGNMLTAADRLLADLVAQRRVLSEDASALAELLRRASNLKGRINTLAQGDMSSLRPAM